MENNVQLIGRTGSIIEVKRDNQVGNLSICTEQSWKDRETGEWQRKSTWHRLVIWNPKLITYIEKNIPKGHLIKVEGELTYQDWTDSQGIKRHDAAIKVTKVLNLQFNRKGEAADQPQYEDEEIPY